MKAQNLITITLMALCVSTVSANELESCSKLGPTTTVQQCMEEALVQAKNEYEAVFDITEKNVKEFDALVKNNHAGLKALVSANSAFRYYQEQQCRFERTMMEPGSGAGNIYRQCMIDLYKAQTKQLKRFHPEEK